MDDMKELTGNDIRLIIENALLVQEKRKEAAMPNKRKREKKTIEGVKYERYEGDDIWVAEATK